MITIKNLSKHFTSPEGEKISIFEKLDLNIASGDFVSIMGPSGRGKTTLLNILSGLDRNYEGSVKIGAKDIAHLRDDEMTSFRGKNISYIFQDFNLIDNLTVEENIDIIIDINKTKRRYTTDEILEKVGLLHKKNQYPFLLSGGERQRVAIARAFVSETKLLLADEPTGSLDAKNATNVMTLLKSMWKNSSPTIIMITHSDEVSGYAQKKYTLSDYSLVESI